MKRAFASLWSKICGSTFGRWPNGKGVSAWEFFYTSSAITSCVFTLLCGSCATNSWSVPEKKEHSDLETLKTATADGLLINKIRNDKAFAKNLMSWRNIENEEVNKDDRLEITESWRNALEHQLNKQSTHHPIASNYTYQQSIIWAPANELEKLLPYFCSYDSPFHSYTSLITSYLNKFSDKQQ